jgi:hypothetical protein
MKKFRQIPIKTLPLAAAFLLSGCSNDNSSAPSGTTADVSVEEIQAIAKDAYVYGFPLVMNLKTIYDYSVDVDSPNYKGPLNEVSCDARLFTPEDTAVVTPNSDTPYCMFWMDLRSEPLVFAVPEMEDDRYYGVQLIDLYTHNYAYIGTRTNDNAAGSYLLAGADWVGEKPDGITEVVTSETDLIFAIIRTQLFDSDDLGRVAEIQSSYALQPLSAFLGRDAPAAAPAIEFPNWVNGAEFSVAAFSYLDFALDLLDTHADETELVENFAKIGIGTPGEFSATALEPEHLGAMENAVQQSIEEISAFIAANSSDPIFSARLFGTRDFLNEAAAAIGQPDIYLQRATGALAGLYGNSGAEAVYPAYFVDSAGDQLNAAEHDYVMTFAAGELPPAKAFWSLSMYDGPTQLFIDNPLDRYLVNSTMSEGFIFEEDGSLVIRVQKDSPGPEREANWLPAPDGAFYVILRLYLPEQAVLDGEWGAPALSK